MGKENKSFYRKLVMDREHGDLGVLVQELSLDRIMKENLFMFVWSFLYQLPQKKLILLQEKFFLEGKTFVT
ncbi:hypothetical protein HY087_01015 [Candidatus Gottesmanbacteria bacterium]|nr:hypothetical protein [Candidatus Gottesmanbacteria bacterium]